MKRTVITLGLVTLCSFGLAESASAFAQAQVNTPTKKIVTPAQKSIKKPVAKPKVSAKPVAKTTKAAPTLYHLASPIMAQFSIGETLRGAPFIAVGTTEQVSGGDISLDWASPEKTTMKPISIDAKTFKTESGGRDYMIRKFILKAEDPGNQYIVFAPKKISGLPKKLKEGDSLSFSIDGDLTIAGITKQALFRGTAKATQTSIIGNASAIVKRVDYKLMIPEVPFVASVDETVRLSINLTASAR